jgi:F0F1-type ATP synthase membrane subunit b/b'
MRIMDIGILVPIIAVSIPMVALLRSPLNRWMDLREASIKQASTDAAEKAAQYAAKTERLEQRVAVLERILTDRSGNLADEIDRLRDLPLN